MASKRKYAYYLKGNKIAIIQREDALAGSSNDEYGMYKSPTEDITDGLEIQYSYSPIYSRIFGEDQEGSFRHWKCLGYTGHNGKLAFILPNEDFSSGSNFTAGDKILIKNSGRWNGIHTVSTTSYLGFLVTTTSTESGSPVTLSCNIDSSAKTITGNSATQTNQIADYFPSGTHYVMIGGTEVATAATNDSELFKVTSDGAGILTATAQYSVTNGSIRESTSPTLAAATGDTISLAKVVYDNLKLYSKASFLLMEDEDFELDISRHQANAIVYYVKAKMAEDAGEFDRREFFLREFKRQVEKGRSALKRGPYIAQGFKEMM